jgi:hypothetical protein
MPKHYGKPMKKKKPVRKVKKPVKRKVKKPVKKKVLKLTEAQNKKLSMHKKHHSAKHMSMMRKLMKEGKSFGAAHRAAQKKVGK